MKKHIKFNDINIVDVNGNISEVNPIDIESINMTNEKILFKFNNKLKLIIERDNLLYTEWLHLTSLLKIIFEL